MEKTEIALTVSFTFEKYNAQQSSGAFLWLTETLIFGAKVLRSAELTVILLN